MTRFHNTPQKPRWPIGIGPAGLPNLSPRAIQANSSDRALSPVQQLVVRLRKGEGGTPLSIENIALELNITVAEVREALLLAGMDHRPDDVDARYGLPQSVITKIVNDYKAGKTLRAMIREYQLNAAAIYRILEGEDIPLRTYSFSHDAAMERRDQEIIEAYAPLQEDGTRDPHKGLPLAKIVDQVGVSQMTIHTVVSKNNIPRRLVRKRKRRNTSAMTLLAQAKQETGPNGEVQLMLFDAPTGESGGEGEAEAEDAVTISTWDPWAGQDLSCSED